MTYDKYAQIFKKIEIEIESKMKISDLVRFLCSLLK